MLDKTYRPAEVETRIYAAWEASGAFAPSRARGGAPYCIMLPPPNVTGSRQARRRRSAGHGRQKRPIGNWSAVRSTAGAGSSAEPGSIGTPVVMPTTDR